MHATWPYVHRLAADGIAALRSDTAFAKGLNTHAGYPVCEAVAEALE
jgi:alanine dehydrogenase